MLLSPFEHQEDAKLMLQGNWPVNSFDCIGLDYRTSCSLL
jgi:hypothetical protein